MRNRKNRVFIIINSIVLIGIAIIMLYPFLITFFISISSPAAVIKGEVLLFPKGINFQAYKLALLSNDLITAYKNTIIYTVLCTFFTLLVACLTAYPLTRKKLKGRKIYNFLIAITMFLFVGIIPNFLIIKELGLLNTIWAIVLPPVFLGFYIFLMRSAFKNIPESIIESAHIDGASEWRILFQIMIPLSKATLMVVGLFSAIAQWNNFLGPLLYLTDPNMYPLTLLLRRVLIEGVASREMLIKIGEMTTANMTGLELSESELIQFSGGLIVSVKMANIMLAIGPIILLYPFVQRYFSKGTLLGSVKE